MKYCRTCRRSIKRSHSILGFHNQITHELTDRHVDLILSAEQDKYGENFTYYEYDNKNCYRKAQQEKMGTTYTATN